MMDDWAEAQAYTCMKESSFSKKRWQTILQLVSLSPLSATMQDRFVTRPFSRNSSSRNGGRCRQFLIVLKGAGWPGWEEPDLEFSPRAFVSSILFLLHTHHSKYPRQMLQHRQNTTWSLRVEPVLVCVQLCCLMLPGHKKWQRKEGRTF